jgi:hypothetical protein
MTKSNKTEVATVAVLLTCIYSGDGESWSAGTVIEVDAEEAGRLISLGAAKPVEKSAPTEEGPAE